MFLITGKKFFLHQKVFFFRDMIMIHANSAFWETQTKLTSNYMLP